MVIMKIVATLKQFIEQTEEYIFIILNMCLLSFFLSLFFWLCWVFVEVAGLSLVAVSGGYSLQLQCMGFSSRWLLCCRAWGSRSRASGVMARGLQSTGSGVVAHGLSCHMACGIFLDQGSNLGLLHWQVDSLSLSHQGSRLHIMLK